MQPNDTAALRHEGCSRKLKNVAVFLESSLEADRKSRGFRFGAATPAGRSWKRNFPPGGALETHGAIAFALRIRNADGRNAVPPAETRHFPGSSLHHAAHADLALVESGESLAQLREGFRIEGSTEMPQPQDERASVGPHLGEAMGLSRRKSVGEFRNGSADRDTGCHMGLEPGASMLAGCKKTSGGKICGGGFTRGRRWGVRPAPKRNRAIPAKADADRESRRHKPVGTCA